MNLPIELRVAAIAVLRAAGFSAAWIYDLDDQSEVVFLVPREEGDFSSIQESVSIGEVVVDLMQVLPHMKVWVTADRDDVAKTRLF